jgi:hypothetical protein
LLPRQVLIAWDSYVTPKAQVTVDRHWLLSKGKEGPLAVYPTDFGLIDARKQDFSGRECFSAKPDMNRLQLMRA